MKEAGLKNMADNIVSDLANEGLEIKEAIKVLKMADGEIRAARGKLFEKMEAASLKETLEEAKGYSSSNGESPQI